MHPPLPDKKKPLAERIDFAPLLRPVGPDFFGPTDKTAFERFLPGHVRSHESKGCVNVPAVEGRVSHGDREKSAHNLKMRRSTGTFNIPRPVSGEAALSEA